MKRIGILGGTFNPIHIGHLAIAEVAAETMRLDKIFFIPSRLPPHKTARNVIGGRQRLVMVQAAIRGNKKFEASDFEVKKEGKSYSIDTVLHFQRKYPDSRIYFIIGYDMLKGLSKWKKINELMKRVTFVAIQRKGYEKDDVPSGVRSVETLDLGISSSLIRRRIRSGKTVRYLVPDSVLEYIHKKKLYEA